MELIKCPYCGRIVVDIMMSCPNCSCPSDFFWASDYIERGFCSFSDIEAKRSHNSTSGMKSAPDGAGDDPIKEEFMDLLVYYNDLEMLLSFSNALAKHVSDSLSDQVTIICEKNHKQILEKVSNSSFDSFPCVFVLSGLDMPIDKRFPLFQVKKANDNSLLQIMHSPKSLNCFVVPTFLIYAKSKKMAVDIANKIVGVFAEPKLIYAPYDSEYSLFSTISASGTFVEDQVSDAIKGANYDIYSIAVFLPAYHTCLPFTSVSDIKDGPLKSLRIAQIAYYTSVFATAESPLKLGASRKWGPNADCDEVIVRRAIESGIDQYKGLIGAETGGLLKMLDSLFYSNEYKQLKTIIANRGMIPHELVIKAFPWQATLYPQFYNDILMRSDPNIVKQAMYASYYGYKNVFDSACDWLGIPQSTGVENEEFSVVNPNMRSISGLEYVVKALSNDIFRSMPSIVEEYRDLVFQSAKEGYKQYLLDSQGTFRH